MKTMLQQIDHTFTHTLHYDRINCYANINDEKLSSIKVDFCVKHLDNKTVFSIIIPINPPISTNQNL